jgi:SEC-C motif-containing protein
MTVCPCGSGSDEASCCAAFLAGALAPTAVALMRSRYTAYVRGDIDYVLRTHDESTRSAVDIPAVTRWSRETQWLGLEIVATQAGTIDDEAGVVEFIARGITAGKPFAQRERSRFRRVDRAWFYIDGKTSHEPVRRAVTAGRNDPCPCGSGLKYKRCHGA